MASLIVEQALPQASSATTALTFSAGLSQPVPLGNSGLSAQIPSGLPTGSTWLVNYTARPSQDLSQIVTQLEQLGDDFLSQLFGTNPAEPYLTFQNLWQRGRHLPDRLTGVLLALAYRTNDLQNMGQSA